MRTGRAPACLCGARRQAPGARGLTLLEVVAALAVLAVGIGALLAMRAEHVRTQAHARAIDRAATLALEAAALVRAGLLPEGRGTFDSDPRYAWLVLGGRPVEPFPDVRLQGRTVSVIPLDDPEAAVVLEVWLRPRPGAKGGPADAGR